jgi:hypothetical protein
VADCVAVVYLALQYSSKHGVYPLPAAGSFLASNYNSTGIQSAAEVLC